jgi:hypothetical protein
MKQYFVFAGDNYYPDGGWKDFKGAFDSIYEAKKFLNDRKQYDWWEIIDAINREVVERFN